MDISIIIVNYNVKDFILNCINSIETHCSMKPAYEIIIIDNSSSDGSVDAIRNKRPHITLIENKKNIGFTRGINQGIAHASGKYIFILNPDTQFTGDSLTALYNLMESNKNIGLAAPKLVDQSGIPQQSYWREPTLLNTIAGLFFLDQILWNKNYKNQNTDVLFEPDCVSGAAIFIRSELLNQLGGLNESLFWMEDMDISLRVKKYGSKIIYLPETDIIHFKGKSSEKNWIKTISNQNLSKIKYFKIHHSFIETLILTIAVYISVAVKLLLLLFIAPGSKLYRKKVRAYYRTLTLLLKKDY